jgi:hypothetical protein
MLFLAGDGASIRKFYLSRTTWGRRPGHLASTNTEAVFKTLRRALDSLREPSLVAVGIVDAWWASEQWTVGARVLVAVPHGLDLYPAFDHTKEIEGPLDIVVVPDLDGGLKQLFRDGQQAKCTAWSEDDLPKPSLRGEYYAWLAGLAPGSRIFRYGCDRYFNRLNKKAVPIHSKVKKGHPYPRWLEKHMFGNHSLGCDCTACGGLGKYYVRRS